MSTLSARPRELRWYHAAGFLFGDWGTSRLYVLGLAFVLSGASSFWYVAAMCLLVTLVGLAYTVVCRHFPDGGGVYSAARQRSTHLAVVGALLLFADYIITAGLSAYVGFRYILPADADSRWALYAAAVSILAMGGMNFFGLRRPGMLAFLVAAGAALLYLVLGLACIQGWGHATITSPQGGLGHIWGNFANVILALSGVEAVANMTGVMAQPVAANARRAILVVLIEVVVLNLVMAYGMSAFNADALRLKGFDTGDQQDFMLKILATEYMGPAFATIASVVFGVLLLSAANTAIAGMVSIQYLMSRDRELPAAFTRLNRFGMPWVSLLAATLVTTSVLLVAGDHTELLASLYAIGVVGAITINLLTCGTNRTLALSRKERVLLLTIGAVMAAIEVTVAVDKPPALLFAAAVLGGGLVLRAGFKWRERRRVLVPASAAAAGPAPAEAPIVAAPVLAGFERQALPAGAARVLVSTRGSPELMKFAAAYARDRKAVLFTLFVREVALSFRERDANLATESMNLGKDREAQAVFAEAKKQCEAAGVQMVPIYAVHDSPAELILDEAATLGAGTLIMGASRRSALAKALRGDVLQEVARYLPKEIPLLIYS